MPETVRLREQNPTVRRFLEEALRRHGYEPAGPDEDFDHLCVYCVDPGDSEADLLHMLDGLAVDKTVLLVPLRGKDATQTMRAHPRVHGVLIKPVDGDALVSVLEGTPAPVKSVAGPHDQATADLASVPEAAAQAPEAAAPAPQTASYGAVGEQRLNAFIDSERVTGEKPSLWQALGFEIALKVPEWAAIERDADRAEAISNWLSERIDR